ncbi:MAG: MBL fold metallo-hydrolase [Bacteriovoracaceae bacterium]|jgi:hydroxyacylglutathione hydrolase|nr:MBL fold metallo-hydrolase [Bacteriovoracaceae bacterium]
MKVHVHFHQNSLRNFSYLLENSKGEAILIDPFSGDYWREFLNSKHLALVGLFFTHDHPDHYAGESVFSNEILRVAHPNARLPFPFKAVQNLDKIFIDFCDERSFLRINFTPGHVGTHLALEWWQDEVLVGFFSGDCLFNAGIGNTKNGGDVAVLFKTVQRLSTILSKETILYPGHDYIQRNLEFNLHYSDRHKLMLQFLLEMKEQYEKSGYQFMTMDNEFKMNPYLNNNDQENFFDLRRLRDQW